MDFLIKSTHCQYNLSKFCLELFSFPFLSKLFQDEKLNASVDLMKENALGSDVSVQQGETFCTTHTYFTA